MNYGWIPSLPDIRDYKYKIASPVQLPDVVDLRPFCPPVYDQGQAGSCTANALAGGIGFDLLKQNKPYFMPSRLFIYFNERAIEGTTGSDSGAQIKDGLKSINQLGVCDENVWAYDITKLTEKPSDEAYIAAKCNLINNYQMIGDGNLELMKQTLASGLPVIFGFTVFDGFESPDVASSGILNMPTEDESQLGGHAVLAVGYNEPDQRFIVRNSWGNAWGQQGYFTIPYQYIKTMATDFWVINAV